MSTAMDAEQMEAEARAAKRVANMLQRPDQLEKLDQYIRRESQKLSSAEAMLKQAVQTHLDGVKAAVSLLKNSVIVTKDIKENINEMQKTLGTMPALADRLNNVKEQSIKHSQYAAAMENLKHIINVPDSIKKTRDWINEGQLLLAHQSLADLENSRDDLLFEMHKLPNQSPTEKNMLKRYFCDVEKLSEELGKQLWLVLGRTLNSVRKEPQVIVTALRIVEREENADSVAESRYSNTGYLAIGRPKRWKKKAFEVLRSAVLERIEGNQFEDRSENKMWLVRHLEVIRQLLVEDLKVVKTACVPCFPPKYEIMSRFVKMYHECIAKHLQDIIANELEGNEYVTLLNWIFSFRSVEMFGHPELNIDVQKLEPLVAEETVEKLISEYLNNLKVNYQDWMKNSLASDVKDWHRDVEPEQNGDGIFHTSLPLIVFNMLDQHFQVAETVSQDLLNRVVILSTKELYSLTFLYEEAIIRFKRKYFEDRGCVRFFTFYTIAMANNCLQFKELTVELKSRYARSVIVGRGLETDKVFVDTLEAFQKLRITVLKVLEEELFMDVNNHLNELATRKWLQTGSEIVDTISCTLEDYCHDYVHLRQDNFNVLFGDIQKKIAINYVYALLQRKFSCKNYEERKQVGEKMIEEGKTFQKLFERLSLYHVKKNSAFEVFASLAEVLKLKDISMLSLEISGILRKYPDMSLDHLVSLILFRGDMSKGDARQLVAEIMTGAGYSSGERTLFADIHITL